MSYIIKTGYLQNICRINVLPILQFKRYRGKINIQRPRKPHYDRALLQAVTTPDYPEPTKQSKCFEKLYEKKKIENPYNEIIAREVRNWLHQSKMIIIYHMNSIKADDLFDVRVALHKQGMTLKSYGKKIITKAVEQTRFETIIDLFDSNHCMVFSAHTNIKELMKITKKVPQMIMLAGIVDNRLLSYNEIVAYSKLPGLQEIQGDLVHTLNLAANHLVQNLQMSQKHLVQILDLSNTAEKDENNSTSTIITTTEENVKS